MITETEVERRQRLIDEIETDVQKAIAMIQGNSKRNAREYLECVLKTCTALRRTDGCGRPR